jgi:hypothetical protein
METLFASMYKEMRTAGQQAMTTYLIHACGVMNVISDLSGEIMQPD